MPKKSVYSEENLQKALKDINNGRSIKSAAIHYSIPRSTLHFRLSNKYVKSSKGPKPILSEAEENLLVDWILDCHKKGFPRTKKILWIQ